MDLSKILSCILTELSSDVGYQRISRKQKTRELIESICENTIKNSNSLVHQELFSSVISLANREETGNKELLEMFSKFAAVITKNELYSRKDEFEKFLNAIWETEYANIESERNILGPKAEDVVPALKTNSNAHRVVDDTTETVQCWKITSGECPVNLLQYVEAHNQFIWFLKGNWPRYIGIPETDSYLVFNHDNGNLFIYESPSEIGNCKVQIRETIITNFDRILMGDSIFEFEITEEKELKIRVITPNFLESWFSIKPWESSKLLGRSRKNQLYYNNDSKISKVHASIS